MQRDQTFKVPIHLNLFALSCLSKNVNLLNANAQLGIAIVWSYLFKELRVESLTTYEKKRAFSCQSRQ